MSRAPGDASVNRDDSKRRVLESTDIVGLISEHVVLKPRGREFVGLCPFHDDKNPSMNVVPHKQMYHCFSCGAGGDAYSFVMAYHKMTFPEAMQFLADRAHIELPKHGKREGGDEPTMSQRIAQANKLAVDYFRRMLAEPKTGAIARKYLGERRINDAMIEAFAIGVAPDAWDALANLVEKNRWDRKAFEQAGLIAVRKSGDGYMDKMRHRLIFPIMDAIGRPIAFGGRVLPDGTREDKSDAKYLNSPETPLFNKSATLFGLNLAHKAISDSRTAVIVEGYTDVIAAHQAGVKNVVATLGTALTADHAKVLRRYGDRVVLVFDADEAGQKAADRALQVFFNEPIDVVIAVLPDGLDPADLFAEAEGVSRWHQAIDEAADAMTFQFRRVRANFNAADSLAGKQRITEDYLRTLVQLGLAKIDAARRGLVLARVADMLLLDAASVDKMIRQIAGARPAPIAAEMEAADAADLRRPTAAEQAQQLIVGCLLNEPALFHALMPDGRAFCETIGHADFSAGPIHDLYADLYEWLTEHDTLAPSDLRTLLKEENRIQHALQWQMHVARLTQTGATRVDELLAANAKALIDQRSNDEYQHQKMLLRETQAQQEDRDLEAQTQRLELAIAHAKANPSARRFPRVVR
ncbi:MAG: DNA primase [Planctomycetes bacterium]|nr:DNA primase [Planctomycetota bacterium]